MSRTLSIVAILVFIAGAAFFLLRGDQFDLPSGETQRLSEVEQQEEGARASEETQTAADTDSANSANEVKSAAGQSNREILVTDGVKHSIPLDEILAGGPPKDGIPSIDDPKFITAGEADAFLDDDEAGLGFEWKGEARFYPYQILVWHEIANDTVQGDPVLVSYCPLCMTGIIFERRAAGEVQEFGVSGRLWRSNLLMYNRAATEDEESLWSQVLGEAVLGPDTGDKLRILLSDTVLYGDWKRKHPDTKVLSRDTGANRPYGNDPYGNYYESRDVSFGASFDDDRLHPKAFVLGIEIDGKYKAYDKEALPVGTMTDQFAGKEIAIEKSDIGEVRMFVGPEKEELSYVGGFWFSWLAVHPDTALFK